MRSTPGFFAAIVFLIAVPAALLIQIIFGQGAEAVIHFVCGTGFALISLAVFNFKLPRWITLTGFVSASSLACIFLLQGVSNMITNDSLNFLAFQVLGQWPESLFVDLLIFWFVAMLFVDSQGKSSIFGALVMAVVIFLELYRYRLFYLGDTLPGILRLLYLLVFVWFLFESGTKGSHLAKESELPGPASIVN
jgi:hypothetical protein